MSVLAQGPGWHTRCEAHRISLSLEAHVLQPHLWVRIQGWFRGDDTVSWLRQPFQVMTTESSTPGSARWKQVAVDVLSWLVFLLMVPAEHPLVALWQVVDWAAINRICAPACR